MMMRRRMKRTKKKKKKKEGTSSLASPKPPDFSLFLSFFLSPFIFLSIPLPSKHKDLLLIVNSQPPTPPPKKNTIHDLLSLPRLPKNNTNTFKSKLNWLLCVANRKPNLFLFQRVQEILTLQITFFVVIASAFECHAQKKNGI